jgi:hypothetical protein
MNDGEAAGPCVRLQICFFTLLIFFTGVGGRKVLYIIQVRTNEVLRMPYLLYLI